MIQKRHIRRLEMDISPLGSGVMRFQAEGGAFSDNAFRLIETAMELGINYYDTAYFYNSGHSEAFLRESLVKKYPRDSFIIADKLPVWLCHSRDDMERIFQEQLQRLGVGCIDIYLLHALHRRTWLQAHQHGVLDFLDDKLKQGQIRKAGFSFHDTAGNLPMIADAYGWDLAQLQINYYDWLVHDVKQAYEYLLGKDIPVVAMEPLGGGRLANLPKSAEGVLREANPDASMASWGIRFCASLPNVAVVLSGMCTESELRENISCFGEPILFTEKERAAAQSAVRALQASGAIACSACRYCTDECPASIDIPHLFQQYNDYLLFNRPISLSWAYMDLVPAERRADRCINCGECLNLCPQKIDIPHELMKVHEEALLLTLFRNDSGYEKKLLPLRGNSLVIFGAGNFGRAAMEYCRKLAFKRHFFCDNNSGLWGTEIAGEAVLSPEGLKGIYSGGRVSVLIASQYHYHPIKKQLAELGIQPIN